jgi:phosphoserine phosphatase
MSGNALQVLDDFVASLAAHPPAQPPVVVFDCDGTVIQGDIGEAMFYRQIERFQFRISPALLLHDHPKRTELGNLYESLYALPSERRTQDRRYKAFAGLLLSRYFDQLAEGRTAKACSDIVRLLAGFRVSEVREIAAATIRTELAAPVGTRMLGSFSLPSGIRYLREPLAYLDRLRHIGAEIWVISGSNRWSVEAVFQPYGIPPGQILGIDLQQESGVLAPQVQGPVPVLEGKLEALRAHTNRQPVLVFSDSTYDLPLFRSSTGLCVLVNSRNGTSLDFFSTTGVSRDERWVVIEKPTLEHQE